MKELGKRINGERGLDKLGLDSPRDATNPLPYKGCEF